MFSRWSVVLSALACAVPVSAQSIVSAHSGVINYFEGSVSIDGQPLQQKFGRFDEMKPGSVLRTELGRAEVLLTPGVLLRVDENSSIRMVSNQLSNTRLELVSGAAALDSRNAAPGAPVFITCQDYQMRFAQSGRYRVDSAPAELRVLEGEADVLWRGKSSHVEAGQVLPLATPFTARAAGNRDEDGLDRWDDNRSGAIAADNKSAAASDDLSNALDNPQDNSYGAGGGGVGGGTGYYGGLVPDPVSSGYYAGSGYAPLWLSSGGFGYLPVYIPFRAYRPVGPFPIRTGTGIYHPPGRSYVPPSRSLTSPAPIRIAPRPVPHPIIHR